MITYHKVCCVHLYTVKQYNYAIAGDSIHVLTVLLKPCTYKSKSC